MYKLDQYIRLVKLNGLPDGCVTRDLDPVYTAVPEEF
jgi:hypothetical protein